MPNPKTLRVLARGSAMVPDYEAQENPYGAVRRFLGRRHDPSLGEEFVDPATMQKVRQGGFRALPGEVVEVPDRAEYRFALRDGDLWAADQATADAAGVKFDPTYGGEHDDALAPPPRAAASPPVNPSPSTATKGA